MKKKPIGALAFAVAGLLAAANPASAQTSFFAAKGLQSNGFERDATVASVGKYGGGNFVTTGYVIFSVQDILANESLAIGDLATTEFKLDFDTITSEVDLADTGTGFVVDYLGFFPNVSDLSRDAFWNGAGKLNQKAAVQTVTPGVFDEAGFGQSITASSFTLSGVTEADSADDYVAFKYSYNVADPQYGGTGGDIPANTVQYLGNHTLTAITGPPAPTGPFAVTIVENSPGSGNYDFEWNSQTGKTYDLVSATDLSSAPATWAVWDGQGDLAATPPTNSLSSIPGGGDTKRFFAVIEKTP